MTLITHDCDVNLVTGEVTQANRDLFFAGHPPLSMVRRYSSLSTERGPLGYGWQHDLVLKLSEQGGQFFFGGVGEGDDVFAFDAQSRVWHDESGEYTLYPDQGSVVINDKELSTWRFSQSPSSVGMYQLTAREDRDGNRIEYVYSGDLLVVVTDSEGRRIRLDYNAGRFLSGIRLAHASLSREVQLLSYVYDTSGDLVQVIDRSGVPVRYEYVQHRLVAVTNQKGGRHFFAYDSGGACVLRWRSDAGRYRRIRRNTEKRQIQVTDSRGSVWLYEFNEKGLVTSQTDPLGRRRETVYDAAGQVVFSTMEPGAPPCVWIVDEQKRIETTICGGGLETKLYFDEHDQPLRIEEPGGRVTRFTYDARDHLTRVVDPDGNEVRFEYSARGEVTAVSDPTGNVTRFTRTGFSEAMTDSLGRVGSSTEDCFANLVVVRDALRNETRLTYDNRGEVATVTYPDGGQQSFRYDAAGLPAEIQYENGARLQWKSDEFGRPTGWLDPLGDEFRIAWDSEDNYLRIKNPRGRNLDLEYDRCNRLVSARHYDGRSTNVSYDANDNPIRFSEGDSFQEFSYDELGLPIVRRSSNGPSWEFGYGANGELVSAESPLGNWEVFWSPGDQWCGEKSPQRELKISRDSLGRRTRLADDRGLQIQYEWDIRSRLRTLTVNDQWTWHFEYDTRDLLVEARTPGDLRLSFSYDSLRRMVERSLRQRDGRILAWRRFLWDRNDDLKRVEDWRLGGWDVLSDPACRLLGVRRDRGVSESYIHDGNNNVLISALAEPVTVDDGNRILRNGSERFEYDDAGNVRRRSGPAGTYEYIFDGEGMLIRAATLGGVVEHDYDFLSRRIEKRVNGVTTQYFWDGEFLQGEHRGNSSTYYIMLPESPIPLGLIQNGALFLLLFDQIGTVTEAFGLDGELRWAADYTAFGYLREEFARVEQPLRALGQYHDRETGLYYNLSRHYDPLLGRYVSADPEGYTYSQNLYWYSSNPFLWVDVDGLGSLGAKGVLTLNWRCDWTEAQKRDFVAKIRDQNRGLPGGGAKVSIPAPPRPCGTAAETWKKCKMKNKSRRPVKNTKNACKDNDADHRLELVLGGKDNCKNMTPRNASVNRSVGSQIGTVLSKAKKAGKSSVTIKSVVPAKTCSPPGKKSKPCKNVWSPNAVLP